MKNLKYLVLLFIAIVLLGSCKKDDPTETDQIPVFTLKINDVEVEENTQATAEMKTFYEVGDSGQLGFNITNNKGSEIKLRMTVVDVLAGANGTDIQICFASCSTSVNLNDTEVRALAGNQTTTNVETHIFNDQTGNRNFECTIKINQVDDDNQDISNGKEVYFTYKYVAP